MNLKRLSLFAALAFATAATATPIHILTTGDMHGWLQPLSASGQSLGGSAQMLAAWKKNEGFGRDELLILSAGDIATGPAISTVYKGVPAVEVMNAMGYDASALGNHEFDFGGSQLQALLKLAQFPFVSANILGKAGSATVVPPYCILKKFGLKIGVIGLTTDSMAAYSSVDNIRVGDYAEALRRWAPQARSQGAQVLIVLAHVPLDELKALAAQTSDLKIPLMIGGHSHELGETREPFSGTWIVNSGEWWKAYSRIDLDYDEASGRCLVLSSRQTWLQQSQAEADPAVQAIVSKWQAKLDADPKYSKVLGTLSAPLRLFWPLSNFICDAWLAMDPPSDIALNNDGAMRQNLGAGPLTRADLIGLLPFTDSMLRLTLSGSQLLKLLPKDQRLMGLAGISRQDGAYILSKTGKALDPQASYHVLLNSFMYGGHPTLREADPHPVLVAKDWRDPLEAWLLQHPSSAAQPLDKGLDRAPRL